jgi:hypothetical protein
MAIKNADTKNPLRGHTSCSSDANREESSVFKRRVKPTF